MRVHYFAAARAATGVRDEEVGAFDTLGQLLDDASQRHTLTTDSGLTLSDILTRCTFLVDGARAEADTSLSGAQRVDVLPPFAGG
ncbi:MULTISPECIES: MoaD/ThiS family protein [unclassified Corynebacterium]|uniref:MoaD/ThiS family protein n=1 Tax=unclassified Corynebacterium TaxID=2624378 RepID=UPI002A911EB8|nr:MoaD/ThiS family protein [Corynebacterium sp.]MDY5786257.1 MoaD/ThiS family protein [Corynebacterium sp.]